VWERERKGREVWGAKKKGVKLFLKITPYVCTVAGMGLKGGREASVYLARCPVARNENGRKGGGVLCNNHNFRVE